MKLRTWVPGGSADRVAGAARASHDELWADNVAFTDAKAEPATGPALAIATFTAPFHELTRPGWLSATVQRGCAMFDRSSRTFVHLDPSGDGDWKSTFVQENRQLAGAYARAERFEADSAEESEVRLLRIAGAGFEALWLPSRGVMFVANAGVIRSLSSRRYTEKRVEREVTRWAVQASSDPLVPDGAVGLDSLPLLPDLPDLR